LKRSRTVLLIDDSIDDILIARRIILKFRPEIIVEVASDGLQALKYFEEETPPELIILDRKLQEIAGVEILEFIRSSQKTRYIPVIILSTSSLYEDIRSAYNAGANSFLHKSHDYHEFTEILTSAIRYWFDFNRYPD